MSWIYKVLSKIKIHVYVVIAYNTDKEKFKDCKVFFIEKRAYDYLKDLSEIYGRSNVCLFSRFIL